MLLKNSNNISLPTIIMLYLITKVDYKFDRYTGGAEVWKWLKLLLED